MKSSEYNPMVKQKTLSSSTSSDAAFRIKKVNPKQISVSQLGAGKSISPSAIEKIKTKSLDRRPNSSKIKAIQELVKQQREKAESPNPKLFKNPSLKELIEKNKESMLPAELSGNDDLDTVEGAYMKRSVTAVGRPRRNLMDSLPEEIHSSIVDEEQKVNNRLPQASPRTAAKDYQKLDGIFQTPSAKSTDGDKEREDAGNYIKTEEDYQVCRDDGPTKKHTEVVTKRKSSSSALNTRQQPPSHSANYGSKRKPENTHQDYSEALPSGRQPKTSSRAESIRESAHTRSRQPERFDRGFEENQQATTKRNSGVQSPVELESSDGIEGSRIEKFSRGYHKSSERLLQNNISMRDEINRSDLPVEILDQERSFPSHYEVKASSKGYPTEIERLESHRKKLPPVSTRQASSRDQSYSKPGPEYEIDPTFRKIETRRGDTNPESPPVETAMDSRPSRSPARRRDQRPAQDGEGDQDSRGRQIMEEASASRRFNKSVEPIAGGYRKSRVLKYSKDAYFEFDIPEVSANVGITDLMNKLDDMTSCINQMSFVGGEGGEMKFKSKSVAPTDRRMQYGAGVRQDHEERKLVEVQGDPKSYYRRDTFGGEADPAAYGSAKDQYPSKARDIAASHKYRSNQEARAHEPRSPLKRGGDPYDDPPPTFDRTELHFQRQHHDRAQGSMDETRRRPGESFHQAEASEAKGRYNYTGRLFSQLKEEGFAGVFRGAAQADDLESNYGRKKLLEEETAQKSSVSPLGKSSSLQKLEATLEEKERILASYNHMQRIDEIRSQCRASRDRIERSKQAKSRSRADSPSEARAFGGYFGARSASQRPMTRQVIGRDDLIETRKGLAQENDRIGVLLGNSQKRNYTKSSEAASSPNRTQWIEDKYLQNSAVVETALQSGQSKKVAALNGRDPQWYEDKINILERKLKDSYFQIELKNQVIQKFENRVEQDKEIMDKLDDRIKALAEGQAEDAIQIKELLKKEARLTKELKIAKEANSNLKKDFEIREDERMEHFKDVEAHHAAIVKNLEEEVMKLKEKESSEGLSQLDQEKMVGEQLREMTAVLEEFDKKYSKKQQQLEIANNQNKQLKEAFDKMRSIQSDLYDQINQQNHELEKYRAQEKQEKQAIDKQVQEKERELEEMTVDRDKLKGHLENKDTLIKEQQVIISELREQLDGICNDQQHQDSLLTKLRERISDSRKVISAAPQRERSQERRVTATNNSQDADERTTDADIVGGYAVQQTMDHNTTTNVSDRLPLPTMSNMQPLPPQQVMPNYGQEEKIIATRPFDSNPINNFGYSIDTTNQQLNQHDLTQMARMLNDFSNDKILIAGANEPFKNQSQFSSQYAISYGQPGAQMGQHVQVVSQHQPENQPQYQPHQVNEPQQEGEMRPPEVAPPSFVTQQQVVHPIQIPISNYNDDKIKSRMLQIEKGGDVNLQTFANPFNPQQQLSNGNLHGAVSGSFECLKQNSSRVKISLDSLKQSLGAAVQGTSQQSRQLPPDLKQGPNGRFIMPKVLNVNSTVSQGTGSQGAAGTYNGTQGGSMGGGPYGMGTHGTQGSAGQPTTGTYGGSQGSLAYPSGSMGGGGHLEEAELEYGGGPQKWQSNPQVDPLSVLKKSQYLRQQFMNTVSQVQEQIEH